MRRLSCWSVSAFALLTLMSCGTRQDYHFPQESWSYHSSPEESGWATDQRATMDTYLSSRTEVTGMMVVHKGQVVYEYGNVSENSYIASCRKSILAILFGKYVENGQIDLDKSLSDLHISDLSPFLDIEKQATIQDLISARSGVFLPGSNGGDFRDLAPERGTVKPGTYWLYSNWDFNTAGFIFEKETGKDIYDELEEQLVEPLGFQDWDRSLQRKLGDSSVSIFPAYHMWMSTRDMARIGLLMLNNGKWDNQQVVPAAWVNEMIMQRTSFEEAQKNAPPLKRDGLDLGYGYMWWLVQNVEDPRLKGAFSAQGAAGQNITIFPAIEAVVAFKTNTDKGKRNSIQTQMNIMKNTVKMYRPE